jgi:hypothetical protein
LLLDDAIILSPKFPDSPFGSSGGSRVAIVISFPRGPDKAIWRLIQPDRTDGQLALPN